MVQINKVEANHDYVMVEYISNGITISTRVYGHDELTPQEIIAKGYEELKPHIQMECDRLGIEADHTLPSVTDEVISIEILGIEDINYTEGNPSVEKTFRCAGRTLYGKAQNLTTGVKYNPAKTLSITPTQSETLTYSATYKGLTSEKSFQVYFKSLADVEAERIENEKRQQEEEKQRIIAEKRARMVAIQAELDAKDYKTIKYVEGALTEEEFQLHKAEKIALRTEYDTLEQEVAALTE